MFQIFAINIVWIFFPQLQSKFMTPTLCVQMELWFHLHSFLWLQSYNSGASKSKFLKYVKNQEYAPDFISFTFDRYVSYKKIQN